MRGSSLTSNPLAQTLGGSLLPVSLGLVAQPACPLTPASPWMLHDFIPHCHE